MPSAAAGGVEARQNPLDTIAARSLGANGPLTRTHTLPHPFMPSAAAGGVSRHAKNPRYGHCAITQGERFINANSHPPQPFMPSAAAGGVSRHAKNPRYDHCAITRGEWFINANSHVPPPVHAECRRRRCRGTLKTLDTATARSLGANGSLTRTRTFPHPFVPSAAAGGVSRHARTPDDRGVGPHPGEDIGRAHV